MVTSGGGSAPSIGSRGVLSTWGIVCISHPWQRPWCEKFSRQQEHLAPWVWSLRAALGACSRCIYTARYRKTYLSGYGEQSAWSVHLWLIETGCMWWCLPSPSWRHLGGSKGLFDAICPVCLTHGRV